ncbi:MAG: potassium channel family protein [Terriglobia bacterium]
MNIFVGFIGLALIAGVLWDAFETIILPRRVTQVFRLAQWFYRGTWRPVRAASRRLRSGSKTRETLLSFYGPLSVLALFVLWGGVLMLGFAMLHWAAGSALMGNQPRSFLTDLYLSGTTFFTLGMGDVVPGTGAARLITVLEAGTGFGVIAIVIAYLPVLYAAFSQRETNISLLDARAGSPPTATELLRRHDYGADSVALEQYLRDWETWSAQLMESHLSYPTLCFWRSQHSNQSWLAALATILDTCALIMASAEGPLRWQARMTFAMSRHAVVDLSLIVREPPRQNAADRLPSAGFERVRELLAGSSLKLLQAPDAEEKLGRIRRYYEPYLHGLSERTLMPLPPWIPPQKVMDNWQSTAWDRGRSAAAKVPFAMVTKTRHFD